MSARPKPAELHQRFLFIPKTYWLLAIVLLAFTVRLYKINAPLADWHSFRQADTASVTREYVKNGVDLLHPRYHDLSNIQSGTRVNGADNIEGWRMVEFPFVNGVIATVLRTFPFLPLVQTSRMFSIIASLGTLLALFYFVKEFFGEKVAYLSALTFAVLPYAIFYSRAILPEPFMLFFSTFSLMAFGKWVNREQVSESQVSGFRKYLEFNDFWLLFSGVSLSLAVLLKPFVIFLAPVYAVLFISYIYHQWRLNRKKKFTKKQLQVISLGIKLGLFFSIAFIPLLLWRKWILQFPSGIPASDWLFNSNGIRFRPAWFRWLGWERLGKLFLGYAGIIFLPFAFLPANIEMYAKQQPTNKFIKILSKLLTTKYLLLFAFWLSILLYFSVLATGNVQHDYYQVLMIPVVCLTVALGMDRLRVLLEYLLNKYIVPLKLPNFSAKRLSIEIVAVLFLTLIFGGWQQVKGYFNVNHWEYIEAGKRVDELLPADAKVIAPAQGDTVFLFQTNRRGWPIGFEIEKKIENGAQYYVTTSYDDEARELETRYETVEKTEMYLILDLEERK